MIIIQLMTVSNSTVTDLEARLWGCVTVQIEAPRGGVVGGQVRAAVSEKLRPGGRERENRGLSVLSGGKSTYKGPEAGMILASAWDS